MTERDTRFADITAADVQAYWLVVATATKNSQRVPEFGEWWLAQRQATPPAPANADDAREPEVTQSHAKAGQESDRETEQTAPGSTEEER